MASVTHTKTINTPDPTQADLDAQIALGNYPVGTTLDDILLGGDYNAADSHTLTLGADENFVTNAQVALIDSALQPGDIAGSDREIQFNDSGGLGASADFTYDVNGRLNVTSTALGVALNDTYGALFANTTAAAAGAQQRSPGITLEGQGWKTNATAGSQSVRFMSYVAPAQGSANPSGSYVIASSINGGAYTDRMSVSSTGAISCGSLVSNGSIVSFGGISGTGGTFSGVVTASSTAIATTSTDRIVAQNTNSATAGVPVQYSPRFRWTGQVWDTGASASRSTNFIAEVKPTSGNPGTAKLAFSYDYNGGGYSEIVSISAAGNITGGTYNGNTIGAGSTSGTNTGDQDLSGLVTGPASATDNAIARYDGATGKLVQDSAVTIADTTGVISGSQGIVLTGVSSPTYGQGKLVYDTDNESLTFYNNDSNVSLQIGQENWVRVRNDTGSTIANGAAVYISGTHVSGLPQIALADADTDATAVVAGLATEAIANNAIGFITNLGLVRNVDTSAFSAGARLFLSSTAGALTATAPASPAYRIPVAVVLRSNALTGLLLVRIGTSRIGLGTANQVLGMNNGATEQEYKTINGTANQVTVTHGANSITLSLPSGIAVNKLAAQTASRAIVSDASGFITTSATTATEIGYVNGATSNLQTQINAKFTLPALTNGSVLFSNGTTISQDNANLFYDGSSKRLGIGTSSPGATLSLYSNDTFQPQTLLHASNDTIYGSYVNFRKQRATGSTLSAGDNLGTFVYQGYDSSGTPTVRNAAFLTALVEAVGAGYVSAGFEFNVVNTSGTILNALLLRGSDGQATIPTTALIGNTVSPSSTQVGTLIRTPAGGGTLISCGSNTALINMMQFQNGNGVVGTIRTTGSNTQYNTSSDYRLKKNIQPFDDALSVIRQIEIKEYDWKSDDKHQVGIIAHELQRIIPIAVGGEKDAIDAEGKINPQGADMSFVVPYTVRGIQQLEELVLAQAATINSLTARVAALEAA